MKAKFSLFIILFVNLLLQTTQAEDFSLLRVLTNQEGLPTNEIKQVYQDKEGYIWIATYNGLCQYDGSTIKSYSSNLYTPTLLSSNNITAIAEDNFSQLWIGTINGLNILQKETGKFRRVSFDALTYENIQTILATKSGDVWIGTRNGLYRYNHRDDSFKFYNNVTTNFQLRGNDIKTLMEDRNGNIWIGT